MVPDEITNKEKTELVRSQIKTIGSTVLILKKSLIENPMEDKELNGEAIANAVLAFRHLEDSAMRLGKVLQALNGGVSQYDNSGVLGQKTE